MSEEEEGAGGVGGGGGGVCSPGKAFGSSSHAVFTAGSIAAKINYRQKQFNPQRPRGTNGLELMG